MKNTTVSILSLALVAAIGSTVAFGQDYGNGSRGNGNGNSFGNNRYDDNAQVIRVTRTNDQRNNTQRTSYQPQQCWNEQTNNYEDGYYRDRNGGLYRGMSRNNKVGAAAGTQVGVGQNNSGTSLADVVMGAIIGNGVATKSDGADTYSYRDNNGTIRRCRSTGDYADYGYNPNNHGYNVTYRYAGRNYQTVTRENPGKYLPITVDVRPRDNNVAYRQ